MSALTILSVEKTLEWLERAHGCSVALVDVEVIYETPVAFGSVNSQSGGMGCASETGGLGWENCSGVGLLGRNDARFWFDKVTARKADSGIGWRFDRRLGI